MSEDDGYVTLGAGVKAVENNSSAKQEKRRITTVE